MGNRHHHWERIFVDTVGVGGSHKEDPPQNGNNPTASISSGFGVGGCKREDPPQNGTHSTAPNPSSMSAGGSQKQGPSALNPFGVCVGGCLGGEPPQSEHHSTATNNPRPSGFNSLGVGDCSSFLGSPQNSSRASPNSSEEDGRGNKHSVDASPKTRVRQPRPIGGYRNYFMFEADEDDDDPLKEIAFVQASPRNETWVSVGKVPLREDGEGAKNSPLQTLSESERILLVECQQLAKFDSLPKYRDDSPSKNVGLARSGSLDWYPVTEGYDEANDWYITAAQSFPPDHTQVLPTEDLTQVETTPSLQGDTPDEEKVEESTEVDEASTDHGSLAFAYQPSLTPITECSESDSRDSPREGEGAYEASLQRSQSESSSITSGSKGKMAFFKSKLAKLKSLKKYRRYRRDDSSTHGEIMRSKSIDGYPLVGDCDESYDQCLTAAKTFPPDATQFLPTIDLPRSIMRPNRGKREREESVDDDGGGKAKRCAIEATNTDKDAEVIVDEVVASAAPDGNARREYNVEESDEVRIGRTQSSDGSQEKQGISEHHIISEEEGKIVAMSRSYTALSQRTAESWQNIGIGEHSKAISTEGADNPLLFLYLFQRDWASALKRINDHPEEASVWIWRKARGYLLWRFLPLHASIILNAPSYLVLEILNAYPNAARQRDMSGSLPIHLAAARMDGDPGGENHLTSQRSFNHIMRAFPDCMFIADGSGRTAIDILKLQGRAVDDCCHSIEPEEDFMLGHGNTRKKRHRDKRSDSFMLESGYTTFSSSVSSETNELNSSRAVCCTTTDDDYDRFKSGFIRVTFTDSLSITRSGS